MVTMLVPHTVNHISIKRTIQKLIILDKTLTTGSGPFLKTEGNAHLKYTDKMKCGMCEGLIDHTYINKYLDKK